MMKQFRFLASAMTALVFSGAAEFGRMVTALAIPVITVLQ